MEDDPESRFGAVQLPPSLVTLTPFSASVSPSPRRLSSRFTKPSGPVKAARQLAWVSLQGRLVGAEEASSARTIGGGLSPEEAVAWDLFSPVHRTLVVAVAAVASANSKKNREICRLRKSVELRDEVLLGMQQKLDNLCEQVNYFKDQPGIWDDVALAKNNEFHFNEQFASDKAIADARGYRLSDQHQLSDPTGISMAKASSGEEMLKYKIPLSNVAEPEERRMSDLSDWASSVTSSVDIQLNSLAIEQDIYNIKKECEEKDATIKELSTFLKSSEVAGSKRIAELEDIIRRKNMIITKLKKDMLVLEQKVVHYTRLRRPSSASSSNMRQPVMTDNLLYDMESTTSSSSSDSDCPPKNRPHTPIFQSRDTSIPNCNVASRRKENSEQARVFGSLPKPTERQQKSHPASPLKERSINKESVSFSRPMQLLSTGGDIKSRRRAQTGSKAVAPHKRWA
ncbi:hypothetical protein Acr_13g0003210 [Actinidia rufa]|uniref:Uncharacterized protein n=1 Tax=Actinidia rufa TaxID=165716 RepID=A0A7J0FJQ8_9ERIC|nr:hypothetical protein Acr_13g0003210 [Actinidia rufa]